MISPKGTPTYRWPYSRIRSMSAMNVNVRRRFAALVLPLLVVVSSACDIAMAEHKEKETAEWRKTYELQPGGRVEIGNINGKIDVRPGQGNTVEVVAEKIASAASREAA